MTSHPKPGKKKKTKVRRGDLSDDLKLWLELRDLWLLEHPNCQAGIICNGLTRADNVHHKKKRGVYLLEPAYLLSTCTACHVYIENHPVWSREHGFMISKTAIDRVELAPVTIERLRKAKRFSL